MLSCMKMRFIDFKLRNDKNVGFGSILRTLFFERVPMLSPRSHIIGHLQPWPMMV
jgi:hypothetical protein